MKLENTLLEALLQKQNYGKSFSDIVKKFENKLVSFDPINNCVEIEKYFSTGNGLNFEKRQGILCTGISLIMPFKIKSMVQLNWRVIQGYSTCKTITISI